MLELDVVNESQTDAVIEVLGPSGADAGYRVVVSPDGEDRLVVERPGPGGWAVTVNGRTVTDWEEWPTGNPVIDLMIVIRRDGLVEVRDT